MTLGNEVVIFFASGRPQFGDAEALIYAMKEAVIVVVRKVSAIPPQRSMIELK